MNFSLFPSEYESKVRAETKNKIEQIKKQSNDRIRALEIELAKRKPISGVSALLQGLYGGAGIGLFIGSIVCTFMCMADTDDPDLAFLVCGLLGAVIGAVMCHQDEKNYSEKFYYMNKNIEEEKRNTPNRVDNIEAGTERQIIAGKDSGL